MKKQKEWTYRPKYTRARIANDLANYEEQLASTLVDLTKAEALKGVEAKDIVYAAFVQMLEDIKFARETLTEKGNEDMDLSTDGFFIQYMATNAFDCLLSNIDLFLDNLEEDDDNEEDDDDNERS